MKIKTNIRAGAGGVNSGGVNSGGVNGGHNSSKSNNTVGLYVPPILLARCVGI